MVGAGTVLGGGLLSALAGTGIPGERVELFGTTRGEAVLGEYGGQARLLKETDPEALASFAVIFLCERSDAARRILGRPGEGQVVIDLGGQAQESSGAALFHMGIRPESASAHRGVLVVPHPLAVVLAELLHPVHLAFGIAQAVAVVLRPASDFGEAGIDELREQTIRLLRFEHVPRGTFGRQLAFNLIPQRLLGGDEADLETRISRQVAAILGWEQQGRLALRLLVAPVYYGHTASVHLRLEREADGRRLGEALLTGHRVGSPSGKPRGAALDAPDSRRTEVCEVTEDGLGGFWVGAVMGDAAAAAAEQAVLAARAAAEF